MQRPQRVGIVPAMRLFWSHAQLKDKAKVEAMKPGQQLSASEIFKEGQVIDVAGTTIGKGFQGNSLLEILCMPSTVQTFLQT